MQARHARNVLASLEQTVGGPQRVRSRLSSEAAAALAGHSNDEWLRVEVDVELSGASREFLVRHQFAALNRQVLSTDLAGPSFRRLIAGARSVLGEDPARWARIVPQIWAVLFKGCGTWAVAAAEPCQVLLTLSGPPQVCLADDTWLEARAVALSALVDAAGAVGAVSLTGRDPVRREARFEWRWEKL